MYPVLLQIGPITLYSLWIFLALAIFLSLLIVNKLSKSRMVKLSFLSENSLLIFFCGLIMARAFFIICNFNFFWETTINNGNYFEILHIWDKGLSVWGALLGVALSLFLLARKQKEDFLAWGDILVISTLFGMTLANLGAFLDGRNYGTPTDLPWGVLFETSQYAVPIHPVQIYAAIYTFIIGIVLIHLFNHRLFKPSGIITFAGITAYSLFRFLEEFIRGDESLLLFDLIRIGQIFSLLGLFFGGYMLYRYFSKQASENS